MSGLSDLYSTQGASAPLASQLAGGNLQTSDTAVDIGLAQTRLLKGYGERQLPAFLSGTAARGNLYSGGARLRNQQMGEDVGNQYADLQRTLDRTRAGLVRQGVLSAYGVAV